MARSHENTLASATPEGFARGRTDTRFIEATPVNGIGPVQSEPFRTISEAANILGLKKYIIERAVRRLEIPHYVFSNSRKYVIVSEIRAFIVASRQGGK